MNLIGDPWIPVVFENGQSGQPEARPVGLRELYERSSEIRDLTLAPPQRIAVMRLLLCITHAALDGPQDEDDWKTCRDRIVPASLAYLKSRCDRFELFGEQPFLQVKELEEKSGKKKESINLDKLDLGLAAGNNATLFDQAACPGGREHDPAWVALHLLNFLNFAGSHKVTQYRWGGQLTAKNVKHGPCLAGRPLLAILIGATLLETIHLNLISKANRPIGPWGAPAWDIFPPNPKSEQAIELGGSFLGRLVPLSRAVRFSKEKRALSIASGVLFDEFPTYCDTMATVIVTKRNGKDVLQYLPVDLDRHPWRELSAVLEVRKIGAAGGPPALRHLLRANLPDCSLWIGGLAPLKAGGYRDAGEWIFRIPVSLLQETCVAAYSAGVQVANRRAGRLQAAVKRYHQALVFHKPATESPTSKKKTPSRSKTKDEAQRFTSRAKTLYWSILDGRYGLLIELANQQAALAPWTALCRKAMFDAYTQACPHATARQIQAFAAGRRKLYLKDKSSPNIAEGDDA